MITENKTILLISPEPWDHIFVSKHHYAIHLAKLGNNVFFLNPPGNGEMISETDYAGLKVVKHTPFVKGLRFFPRFLRLLLTRKKFNRLQEICGVKFDIVWSFDNSVFFEFSALPPSVIKISHIVDLNQNFETKKAASSSDVCFGVIPAIVDRLKQFNELTFLIPHGVNTITSNIDNVELPGSQQRKALYVGNLAMPHINWKLLLQAAERFEHIDFIFLGSNRKLLRNDYALRVLQKHNVFVHNQVQAIELSAYLRKADILIYAYTADYYRNYATPHKVMEYLLTGNPVVGNYIREYDGITDLIYMGNNDLQWIQKFQYVIDHFEVCASVEAKRRRIFFAEENTYYKHLERISRILEDVVSSSGQKKC